MAIFHSRALYFFLLLLLPLNQPNARASQKVWLFTVEKRKNPENILVVYSLAGKECTIEPVVIRGKAHNFDMYWLMDGTRFKPTHPLIKKHARKRFVSKRDASGQRRFKVRLADLKELVHDLPSDTVTIDLYKSPNGSCGARVLLPLGPSANHRTMEIQSVYSKARTLLGIPIGVHYIELRGVDAQTRKALVIRLNSKRDARRVDNDTTADQ